MWRWMLRWLARFTLTLLALAAVSSGAVLIVLHTDWGRERIRRSAEDALERSFPGGARIGRFEGSVLGELVARDVELRAADGALWAKIGALRLELAFAPLIGKTAELERVVAEDVELYPLREIAPPDPEEDPPGTWSVELPLVEVHRARIVLETAPGEAVTLDGVELTAQVAIPAGAPIAAAARLRGTWRERGVPIEGEVAAIVDGAVVTLPRLDVRAGEASVRGSDVVLDPAGPTGALHVDAPARAVAALVPGVVLPGDVRLAVTATRAAGGERGLAIDLDGGVGASRVTGKLIADPAAPRVRGVITARDVALAEVTRGAHTGTGTAIVAFVADRARIRGTAIATGRVDALPAGDAVVSFDAALDPDRAPGLGALARAAGLVVVAGADGSSARGLATLARRADGALAIDAGQLAIATPELAGLAGDLAPVRGRLALAAALGGTADPLDVTVRGTLDGRGVAYGAPPASLAARRLYADFRGAAVGSLARATGEVTGFVRGVSDAGVPRGDADLRAALRGDRTIAAWAQARPAAVPGLVATARATITPGGPGETTLVELGEHAIALPGGERWQGRGGRVVIGPERVTVERLRTASQGGHLEAGATIEPATGRLVLALDAAAISAASIDPAYRGAASGSIRLQRRGARWDGTIALDGRGLAFAPDAAPLDAELRVTIDGRRVVLASAARTAALGGVRFELDVDGPADLTDPAGWRRLPRAAVRSARLSVDGADLAAAAVPTGGVVDGSVYIAGADTTGTMRVRGVQTPLGEASGDITFRPEDRSELGATSTVHVAGLGAADVSARIAFPVHPFDPAAWQQLGRGALSHLGASLTDVQIDPARLAALGVTGAPYRGVADVAIAVAGGATSATVEVEVTGISGGPIVAPLDVHVTATADARAGTRVVGQVHAAGAAGAARGAARTQLASLEATVPSFTLDRWLTAPDQARHAPIVGGLVSVPGPGAALSAPALLAVLGRDELAGGTVSGKISIGGTLGTPTAEARLALSQLAVARRVPGKPAPRSADLTIDARWGGASGRVAISGRSGGGTLRAQVEGAPSDLARIRGSVTATDFDLAPIAALLPGDLAAVEGKLRASLTVRGLDSLARLRGSVAVAEAVVPLDPMLGTLREGTARAAIDDRGVTLAAEGALGSGRVSLTARSAGHDLALIEATGKLDDVSPLGEWEPVIDADLEARFRRSGAALWTGTVAIRNASAVLPPSGSDLGDPDKPTDLLFVEDGAVEPRRFALGGRPPDRPWLVADLELEPMKVLAEDLFDTRGEITGKLRLSVGEAALGLVGSIEIESGVVGDLFGRRYTATGGATFDGSLAPKVDITLQHKFPALVLTVLLRGDPATLVPEFESDPATYTRDQLAGFFIGGEPGGDPSAQTREAATGAGAAVLSSTLGARIRKRLPIRIEQLGCDPGNSVTAASCTVGRWFGDKLFVAFKRRIDAQEREHVNANEVQGQYYLRRDLYLEMVGGDAGSGGLDLLWRRRW
jgi:hypothetical protein